MTEPVETSQFDFWVGEWEVLDPEGRVVGHNSITRLLGGRALSERWSGAGGVGGASLSSWDAARGRWHQTWMDSTGSTLLLDGGLVDGAMVLEGDAPDDEDASRQQRHRITWTPGDGEVRQVWEVSDDGSTWSVAFDGRYRPAPPA
jgi:hypothetical protein